MATTRSLVGAILLLLTPVATVAAPDADTFREKIVSFSSGDARIEATLYLPDRAEKVPGIVLVHGSGPNPRDGFKRVAAQLAGAGYAVLNYDKRGVGGSNGAYPEKFTPASLQQLAADASAALSFLAKRPEVKRGRLGFWGVSQAGWVVPRAARMNRRASFMLLVSAPATGLHDVERYQKLTQLKEPAGALTPDQIDARAAQMTMTIEGPDLDPGADLRRLRLPALWLMGDRDWIVPPGRTVAIVEALAKEGKPFQARVIKDGGHLMAWLQPEDYWPAVRDWLAFVTKSGR